MITIEEVSAAVNYLRDISPTAARARAEAQYLDEFSKSLKATIMMERKTVKRDNDAKTPIAQLEMEALADERYITHLEAVRIATEHDLYLRHLLHAAEVKIDVWRSEQATERALGKV